MHLIEDWFHLVHVYILKYGPNMCALNYLLTQFQMQSDETVQQQEQPHRN